LFGAFSGIFYIFEGKYIPADIKKWKSEYLQPILELASTQNYISTQSEVIMENNFFTKNNYILIFTGIVMLFLGFYALSRPPVNGFWTMKFAPIILTIAYCVVFPIAIILKPGSKEKD